MNKENKHNMLLTIISVIVLLTVIGALTYAFFTANVTSEGLNVTASFENYVYPVFTAVPSNDLELEISTADMLETEANTSKSSYQTIDISLEGGTINFPANCEFNFAWIDTSLEAYVPTPAAVTNDLDEYTIKITDQSDNIVLQETRVNSLTSEQTLLNVPQSISTTGNVVHKIYKVTATIYNLDFVQTINNKHYSSRVSVTNVTC